MSRKKRKEKSVSQRVANRARERGLTRDDGFTAYAMDRLLHRLGRSSQAGELYLKGGVLVANLIAVPHRFTRDIDVTCRYGRCDPQEMRERLREVIAISADDGVSFESNGVSAVMAEHDRDGYDGIKVRIRGAIGAHRVMVQLDIGFGDAVVPPARHVALQPYLTTDQPARVLAYPVGSVVAEKVETLVSKFPLIAHRLKDLLDVVMLANALSFDGPELVASIQATFKRRGAHAHSTVLDDMAKVFKDSKWRIDWVTMCRNKNVQPSIGLTEAVQAFDIFVRPLLTAMASDGSSPGKWSPGGPWS